MNCYIFDIHIDCCFLAGRRWEDGISFYTHDLVEVGPINMIYSRKLTRVKNKVRSISLVDVHLNWWTEFWQFWQDYRGLLSTGTTLKIHEIVKNFSKYFETVENIDAHIEILMKMAILKLVYQKTVNIYFKVSRLDQAGKD